MRWFLLIMLALTGALPGLAEGPQILTLSRCPTVVKITNPARQLAVFAPVLDLVERLQSFGTPAAPAENPVTRLKSGIQAMSEAPGIAATGQFWIVTLPAVLTPARPAPPAAAGEAAPAVGPPRVPAYLIAPLANAEAFRGFTARTPAVRALILGDHALLAADAADRLPAITGIDFDLPLVSKREVVLTGNLGDADIADSLQSMGPFAVLGGALSAVTGEMQRNVARFELGAAMAGDDLSVELFAVPVAGGSLAKQLATVKPDALALEFAGYLPDNLAYCGVGGPMLDGAPGINTILLRTLSGLATMFMSPEQQEPFCTSLDNVMALCSHGRVLAVTASPVNTPGPAAMIGIYRIPNPADARTVVQAFVKELSAAPTTIWGGALKDVIKVEYKPAAEQADTVKVDVLRIALAAPADQPPANADANAPPPKPSQPFHLEIECRLAYVDDKLLCTLGPAGKAEMSALVGRLRSGNKGFTESPRFQALKATLPEQVYGYETYAPVDLMRVLVNTVFPEASRAEPLKWLSGFPPQRTTISTYQQIDRGCLRTEIRVPGEQMNTMFTLVKMMVEMGQKQPAPPAAGKDGK